MFPITADFPREPSERRNGARRPQEAGLVHSRGAKTVLYGLITVRKTGWRKAEAVASHKRVRLQQTDERLESAVGGE